MAKHSYQHQLRRQIQQWQARIEGLGTQAGEDRTGRARRIEEQIKDLRAKQEAARRKLAELERAPRGLRGAARAAVVVREGVNRIVKRFVPGTK